MQMYLPTSNETGLRRAHFYDVLLTVLSGPLAIVLREPDLLSGNQLASSLVYSGISAAAGIFMLLAFDLGRGLARYTSMRDAIAVAKMALATVALTSLGLFTLTRLDDVPRSIPALHFLVLTSLLLACRAIAVRRRERGYLKTAAGFADPEQVLVIGANRLTWFYLRMVETLTRGRTNVVAVLDANPAFLGRTLYGRPVLAPPSDLSRVVTEYAVHGVRIDRIIVSSNRAHSPDSEWEDIETYCGAQGLRLSFLPDDLGIDLVDPVPEMTRAALPAAPARSAYFKVKRGCEFVLSLAMLCFLAPVLIALVIAVLIDVGWPAVFWQKRVGYLGQPLLVYKFRTLHAPFDRRGEFVEEKDRVSKLGNLLRRLRLDELPQLWNILAGNMSFVGPRPLLPVDQPENSERRLSVLPGITGWAQISGGKLVSQEDKGRLDEWYVQNASFRLDARIILRTFAIVVTGDRESMAVEDAASAGGAKEAFD